MNRFQHWMVGVAATSMVLLVDTHAAWACAVCFGAPDDAQTIGMNMAIATMLSVTGVVMAFIVSVAVMVWRRTLAFNAQDEGAVDESSSTLSDEVPDA